jgi:hypothetical protein
MIEDYEPPAAHDNKMILQSESFRALNVFIDNQAKHLVWLHEVLKHRMERILQPSKYGAEPTISTRSAQEDENNDEIPLLFESRDFDNIINHMKEIKETESLIGQLVLYKIRLLNDWDFTKGDNSEQIAVFGPVPDAKD